MAENEFINEGDLPFSLEAEQAVLGSILLDPSCLVPVSLIIKTVHTGSGDPLDSMGTDGDLYLDMG